MPDKSKAPKELVDLAEDQAAHAAKNLGAAATKAVEEILPKPSGGIFIPNKALGGIAGVAALGVAIAVANRIKQKKAEEAEQEEANLNGSVVRKPVVVDEPGRAA